MARKSIPVKDIVPLNREKLSRKLGFVKKNLQKGIEVGLIDEDLNRSIFFQQEALAAVKGKKWINNIPDRLYVIMQYYYCPHTKYERR